MANTTVAQSQETLMLYGGIVAAVIMLTILIVVMIKKWGKIIGSLYFRYKRQRCHHEDCRRWTLRKSEGYDGCAKDTPCCRRCNRDHESKIEPKYTCPVCKEDPLEAKPQEMMRGMPDRIIINYDVCLKCGHILVSRVELWQIVHFARDTSISEEDKDKEFVQILGNPPEFEELLKP